jgi:predicted DNA-binding protein
MIRKNIYITEAQHELLIQISKETGYSISELIRQAIEAKIKEAQSGR